MSYLFIDHIASHYQEARERILNQYKNSEAVVWILATGFWNDAGSWEDGNVWID